MIHDFLQSPEKKMGKNEMLGVERWMATNFYFIQPNKTLKEAAQMIEQLDVDYLPIVSEEMMPVGMVTPKMLLNSFVLGNEEQSVQNSISWENLSIVHSSDSLLDIYQLPFKHFTVVNDQDRLVGTLSRSEILKGISRYIEELNQTEHTAETLNIILESAYEGVAVVDEEGIVLEFNEAYTRFTGIKKEYAFGRHVTEVIDNTNLHNTVKTGMPERGVIQYIQGQAMIVHRIPIWKNGKVIGAIGMLIFEGVTEVYRIYERLLKDSTQQQSQQQLTQRSLVVKEGLSNKMTLDQIIGESDSTSNVKRIARKVAKTNATILITGESGTGKEMYAKSIHHLSAFSFGPFVSINCGAIPENLFESELFGYEEGAFTGAKKGGKPGKFELAQNGTLFLDEIGEMPHAMQIKLLRVLQEREFERVGGIQKYDINTRIIAATNRNLKEMVKSGDFREDLYYRINIIELPISPLRERVGDIPPLVSYYLNEICTKYRIQVKKFTSRAMSSFLNYRWEGNIRELVNTIEKLVILVEEEIIDIHHLPNFMVDRDDCEKDQITQNKTTAIKQAKNHGYEREKELIVSVLEKTEGNKSKAARELGIHRTTLYQKLKRYNLV